MLEAKRKVDMEKLIFALDVEDGWPPVSAEGVWCEKVGQNYTLKNAPFFIPNLAVEDTFSAITDDVNEQIFEYNLEENGGHSLVWLMNNINLDLSGFFEKITDIGCFYEGLKRFSLATIDVPPGIDVKRLNEILDEYEGLGIDFAFPVWRFE